MAQKPRSDEGRAEPIGVVGTVTQHQVSAEDEGVRLDRWFKRHLPAVGHVWLEQRLRTGQVRLDGGRARAGDRVHEGQIIRVPPLPTGNAEGKRPSPPQRPVSTAEAEALRAAVTHCDDDIIILNKAPGLAVQGGSGLNRHLDGMLDALRFGGERPRLVHRLDRDTSGVLVLARRHQVAATLAEMFRHHVVQKLYWAIVVGQPPASSGRIDRSLAKQPGVGGERMRADDEGDRAITDYRVIERASRRAAWLALEPLTGRTHQLRAHCALLGTPILGDGKYGGASAYLGEGDLSRSLHLHARALRLPHPAGHGTLAVTAPLPEAMKQTWDFFGFTDERDEDTLARWPVRTASPSSGVSAGRVKEGHARSRAIK